MRQWLNSIGSAASRLLNAITLPKAIGARFRTFSAESWRLHDKGAKLGTLRVLVIDLLNFNPTHCRDAYQWHLDNGLFALEE